MNTLTLCSCSLVLALALIGGQHGASSPSIPAPFPPIERVHPGLPIDQPPSVLQGDRRHPPNLKLMKKQAAELATLAQSISPDLDEVGKGKLPKDLVRRLKLIDKLSKQLKRELSQ